MSKREEEMIDEMIGSIFGALSGVPVKVVTVGKSAAKTAEKTAKKVAETAKECAACRRVKEPKLTDFIDNVICQDSAVVIFWKDGTKTTAKCGADDVFDYEKGLAIAALKYVFGNKVYQVDMKEIMEAYPRTMTTTKKKAVAPVEETASEAPKKTTAKKAADKEETEKKPAVKKTATAKKTTKKSE